MARDTDVRPSGGEARSAGGDGADWAVLALAPLALAAMMLIAAAAFAEGTEDPAAAAGQNTATEESAPDQTDCVAAGGETVEGMPATKHQEQVLTTDEEAIAGLEPAAGCPATGEMPATQHQEDVLDPDQEGAAPAQ
jgi:hypothetical protein